MKQWKVAAIYDIHGNLPALEAVLQEIRQERVEHIVVGGDILPGPMPSEVLDLLLSLDIPTSFIYGNCEAALLDVIDGKTPKRIGEQFMPIFHWTASQFRPEQIAHMRLWPKLLTMEIAGVGEVLFCHATPRDENDIFTRLTPEDKLLPIFEGVNAPVVVCGHTHMQFDRLIGQTRVVNAGSVGSPHGEPGAYWLLLGPDLQFKRTLYDFQTAAERVRRTDFPDSQNFAEHSILQPLQAEEMVDLFTRAGL